MFLVFLIPTVISLVFYTYLFVPTHFTLIEARDYVGGSFQGIHNQGFITYLVGIISDYHIAASRMTNQLYYIFSTEVCGINVACQNFGQVLLICFSAGLMALFIYQLIKSRWLAFAGSAFWVFSFSALHTAFWQATAFDKLCGFFSLSTLNFVVYLFNRKSAKWQSGFAYSVMNIILCVLLFACFAAKEHGILVAPAIFSLIVVLCFQNPNSSYKKELQKLILPAVFFLTFTGFFVKNIVLNLLRPGSDVLAGNPFENTIIFLAYVFNQNGFGHFNFFGVVSLLLGATAIISILTLRKFKNLKPTEIRDFGLMIWALIVYGVFIAAIAGLRFQNPYYMFVPSIFFYTFLIMLFKNVLNLKEIYFSKGAFRHALRLATVGTLVVLLSWHLIWFGERVRLVYLPALKSSANFLQSGPILKKILGADVHNKQVVFASYFRDFSYMYLATYKHAYVASFLFQDTSFIMQDGEPNFSHLQLNEKTPPEFLPDHYYVFYGDDLQIQKLVFNGKNLYEAKIN